MKKSFYVLVLFFYFLLINNHLDARAGSMIADTDNALIYEGEHHTFHNGNLVKGFVRINNGFTLDYYCTLTLDTFITVSGGIELQNTGKVVLLDSLRLDPTVTFSPSGGQIDGKGNTIFLEGGLSLPDNCIINIVGDTIIDGNGGELNLGKWSQISIDSNVTLTLKNMTLSNSYTTYTVTPIRPAAINSQLALDKVNVKLADDFDFDNGQLFIHNDVVFTGTYKFKYNSVQHSRITSNSCLYFDEGITFEYYPSGATNNLIEFEDRSSCLYLNGCDLITTHTGIKLTTGRLLLDGKLTLSSAGYTRLDAMDDIFTINTDISSNPRSVAWSPDGVYLAVVGDSTSLEIYRFNSSQFQFIASVNHGASSVNRVVWHPSGKYLAICSNRGGQQVEVFLFDRETNVLSSAGIYDTGGTAFGLSWSPNGYYLAVGIFVSGSLAEVIVLGFNGSTLSFVCKDSWGTLSKVAFSAEWSPDGLYLLAGGNEPDKEIVLYSFNGVALTEKSAITSEQSIVRDCKWSPNQNYVAVASGNSPGEISVYPFEKDTGTLGAYVATATLTDHGGRSTTWSNDGNYVFVGLDGSGSDIKVYIFDGTSLTEATNLTGGFSSTFVWSLAVSPNGKNLAAGFTASNLNVKNYKLIYGYDTAAQAFSNSIVFGDSSLGTDKNLDVNVLGQGYIELNGKVFDDNV